MAKKRILIKNGRLIDPANNVDIHADLFIADGKILSISASPDGFSPDQIIDASHQIVCPGLVDLCARLGSIEPELAAAVAGGITSLVCPPDASPVLDEPGLVERLIRRSEQHGLCRVFPVGALTQQLAGEKIAEMNSLARAGCVAFSQVNRPLPNTQLLLRAMQYAKTFDYPIIFYPQDYYLTHDGVAHNGEVAARLGLPAVPACAETVAIATALILAEETGARLHFAHLSSAQGIVMVRQAQDKGMPVSCDVSVHHLHLSEEDIGFFNTQTRLNPPLRAQTDRQALRKAAAQGHAAICSDHTPVNEDGKQLPFAEATPGATGVELLLPLTLQWAKEESVPLVQALARITCDPAGILGLKTGTLEANSSADICIFNPDEEWQVAAKTLASKGKNSPFIGAELTGRVRTTLVAGKVVYTR